MPQHTRSADDRQHIDTPNRAANREPAEGPRHETGGISNRTLDEERDRQEHLPPRGGTAEDEDAE